MPKDPSNLWDIISFFSYPKLPRVNFKDATIRESMDYICFQRFHDIEWIEPPPRIYNKFRIEYRLSEATLKKEFSVQAENVTVAQAIKLLLKDVDVAITIETGKVILSEPSLK